MCFQIIAIIILVMFYGCYFSKMFIQKKKGIQTDQMGKGKKGFVKLIEITMKITSIFVVIAEIISIFLNTSKFHIIIRGIGAIIGILGVVLFGCSVHTMRDNWRAGVSETDKTQLVTNGIYQISRNPAFLGFDLVYIGFIFMFFNWILFVLSAFAILMFHLQIVKVEENFLVNAFDSQYLSYKNKVNRYLGRK